MRPGGAGPKHPFGDVGGSHNPLQQGGLRMSEKNLAYVSIHVRLLDEQYEWLRKYCFENRISQAEVVREALQIFRQKKDNLY
jgi:hypothetical protein